MGRVLADMRPASEAIQAMVLLKVWTFCMALSDGRWRLIGCVRPASVTSVAKEAIKAEVLLKVWDILHPRAVGEGSRPAQLAVGRSG